MIIVQKTSNMSKSQESLTKKKRTNLRNRWQAFHLVHEGFYKRFLWRDLLFRVSEFKTCSKKRGNMILNLYKGTSIFETRLDGSKLHKTGFENKDSNHKLWQTLIERFWLGWVPWWQSIHSGCLCEASVLHSLACGRSRCLVSSLLPLSIVP